VIWRAWTPPVARRWQIARISLPALAPRRSKPAAARFSDTGYPATATASSTALYIPLRSPKSRSQVLAASSPRANSPQAKPLAKPVEPINATWPISSMPGS
jgi:hypothetical protein